MAKQLSYLAVAMIRRGGEVLLVRQQGPGDPEPSWAVPGGRVELGEVLPATLVREVREETGLTVLDLRPADPDLFVLECRFVPLSGAIHLLEATLPWRVMRDPAVAYLRGDAPPGTLWVFQRESPNRDRLLHRIP